MGFSFLEQLELLLRVAVAGLCGAVIGYERESRMKTAGIRTHLIVAIAAALMMVVSKYGFNDILGSEGVGLDPSRIAAGVVTAIGFLGAGMIFVRKQNVSGLTTAAGVWATVGVGTAIGAGMYFIGIAVSAMIVAIQIFLHRRRSRFIKEPVCEQLVLQIAEDENVQLLFAELLESRHIEITSMKAKKISGNLLEIRLSVRYPEAYQPTDLIKLLTDTPSIKSIDV